MKSATEDGAVTLPRPATGPWPRRFAIGAFALLLLAAVGYYAYDRFFKPQEAPTAAIQTAPVTRGSIVASVSATGSVVPAQTAELSFGSSGRLAELHVVVGQTVKKGDVLARLDASDLQLAVLEAEAKLASAQSTLASLEAGSTEAEIAQARAQLKSAQSNLEKLKAGPTTAELQSAEAAVVSARAQLDKAQNDLAELQAGPSQDKVTSAKIALEKARITLQDAQAAYDKIAWRPDAGATKEAMTLWQATTDYQAAEIAYRTAVAGPTPAELAQAQAAVETAKAQLASAEAKLAELKAGPTEDELAGAEAAVLQAQTALEQKLNPTTPAQLQAARAAVEQAKAGLENAKSALEKATMVAPFDGVVAAVSGSVGQTITGTVVTLLDLSAPQVQITLPETDVAKVEVGQEAILTFEALGGQQLAGKVLSITPKATVQSGVATYTAYVSIERTPPRLDAAAQTQGQTAATRRSQSAQTPTGAAQQTRSQATVDLSKLKAGMTSSVTIVYLRKDDVLMVPNRAIRAQGRDRVVDVVVDGRKETRAVSIGAADDQHTEITSGLQEGDQVVVAGATTTTTSTGANRSQEGAGSRFVPGVPGGFPR